MEEGARQRVVNADRHFGQVTEQDIENQGKIQQKWIKEMDNEAEEERRKKRLRATLNSERTLNILILIWCVVVIGIFIHVASVFNQASYHKAKLPPPKHYMLIIYEFFHNLIALTGLVEFRGLE